MVAQTVIGKARFVELLNPFHPARREVGRGPQTGAAGEDLVGEMGDFERHRIGCSTHAEHCKELATNFVDIRIAPLDYMGRLGQRGAESFEVIAGHGPSLGGRAWFGNGDRLLA